METESATRRRLRMPCCFDSKPKRTPAGDQREIRRLRLSLFSFINSKQQPKNYTMMIRYLMHWQVSVYSLVLSDVLLWATLYTIVNVVYRHVLNQHQQDHFVRLVHSVGVWQSNVPVTFLLGFYVSSVVDRWWCAYMSIPTIGTHCLRINAAVGCRDRPEKSEAIRITIARYMNLAWLLYMWKISEKVKQRFRILRSLISEANKAGANASSNKGRKAAAAAAGSSHLESSNNFDMFHFRVDRQRRLYPALQRIQSVREDIKLEQVETLVQDLVLLNQDPVVQENYGEIITPSEIAVFVDRASSCSSTYSIEYELPLHWAVAVAKRALADGFITAQESYDSVISVCSEWSTKLGIVNKFASKNLPLVYTQVVIIAVYTWFFIEVVSSQNLIESHVKNMTDSNSIPQTQLSVQYWTDFYVPVFAMVKLLFVLGWFKVAFILMDPFGDDMDDLPFSDILNSNLRKGRLLAGFSDSLYPRKLRPGSNEEFLHSDDDLTQDLINEQAGPWLETVQEKNAEEEEEHQTPSAETRFREKDTEIAATSQCAEPLSQFPEVQPLLQPDIP